jgi:hypothetical protein
MYRVVAQWASGAMFLAPLAENALHQGPGTNVLDVAENRDVVSPLWLPTLLDTVVDKRDQTGCHYDAAQC